MMDTNIKTHHHHPQAKNTIQSLYFAYGSNLSLEQMAARCPESRYIGTARLHDYRWQINQRGYANVVHEPGNCVEGLCYILSGADEARLDRYEGVPVAYEKVFMELELFTAKAALVGRDVAEIVAFGLIGGVSRREEFRHEVVGRQAMTNERGDAMPGLISSHPQLEPQNEEIRESLESESKSGRPESPERGPPKPSSRANTSSYLPEKSPPSPPGLPQHLTAQKYHSSSPMSEEQSVAKLKMKHEEPSITEPTTPWSSQAVQPVTLEKHGEKTLALIYISYQYTTDDLPRQEYIIRMHRAVRDGMMLGMSRHYINTQITPRLQTD